MASLFPLLFSIVVVYVTCYVKQVTLVLVLLLTINNFLENYNRDFPAFYASSIGILRKKITFSITVSQEIFTD